MLIKKAKFDALGGFDEIFPTMPGRPTDWSRWVASGGYLLRRGCRRVSLARRFIEECCVAMARAGELARRNDCIPGGARADAILDRGRQPPRCGRNWVRRRTPGSCSISSSSMRPSDAVTSASRAKARRTVRMVPESRHRGGRVDDARRAKQPLTVKLAGVCQGAMRAVVGAIAAANRGRGRAGCVARRSPASGRDPGSLESLDAAADHHRRCREDVAGTAAAKCPWRICRTRWHDRLERFPPTAIGGWRCRDGTTRPPRGARRAGHCVTASSGTVDSLSELEGSVPPLRDTRGCAGGHR